MKAKKILNSWGNLWFGFQKWQLVFFFQKSANVIVLDGPRDNIANSKRIKKVFGFLKVHLLCFVDQMCYITLNLFWSDYGI